MSDPGVCSRPSPIAGLGLFATRAFAPQERIAAYSGRVVTRPPDEAKASGKVFALEIAPGTWLDGSTEDNLSRHANHACHPNAELVWDEAGATAWLTATHPIATPVNWQRGQDVMIQPSVSDDKAAELFPGFKRTAVSK